LHILIKANKVEDPIGILHTDRSHRSCYELCRRLDSMWTTQFCFI